MTRISYQHCGQHGRQHLKAVERLKYELEHLEEPYALTVLDSNEWAKSKVIAPDRVHM